MFFVVCGDRNDLSTWSIVNSDKDFLEWQILAEFSYYINARKWILSEIKIERDKLGKLMKKWYEARESENVD